MNCFFYSHLPGSVFRLAALVSILGGNALPVYGAGYEELYDPFVVRTIHLKMEPGSSWGAVVSDGDFNNPQNALLSIEGETPVQVTVKRKSDPAVGQKVSVKIDINERVPGQDWHGVKKLSLENGADGGIVKEGFAWQMHRLASEAGFYGYSAAQAAWVRLVVDGQLIGVYTSVEERDKQMLENRGMWKENATWLYKNDPNPGLEAGTGNSPSYQHFCFPPFRNGCAQPNLESDLSTWIDMQGMLTLGAIEAFTGNHDGLFTHDGKNHFFADFAPPTQLKRLYFPWDLDTGISDSTAAILGAGGDYSTQILGHPWFRQWFLHTLDDLLDGPLSARMLTEYLNRLEPIVTPAFAEDPNSSIEGGASAHFESLRRWVTNRIANVRGQIGGIAKPPRFDPPPGEIVTGAVVSLEHTNSSGTIYFTLDGSDPRAVGGSIFGMAYSGPLVLTNTTHIATRILIGTNWSALRRGTFNIPNHAAALRVTELMYDPAPPLVAAFDNSQYEFIEMQNRSNQALDLSGCEFDGIGFRFVPGTRVEPNDFVLLVRNALAFTNRYPGISYHGIFWGGLDNEGEKVRLKNSDGNNIFSVEYHDGPPWPLGALRLGWSLINTKPSSDPDDPENWSASANRNGSPGNAEPPAIAPGGVIINEVLSHTDAPLEDAVELLNTASTAVDISGWWLSDQLNRADVGGNSLKKFRIPNGTLLEPGGTRVFYEFQFNDPAFGTNAFALSSFGDQIYLASATADEQLTGYIVGASFGASENGCSVGRVQTSVGWDFAALEIPTFGITNPTTVTQFREGTGAINSKPRFGSVVINEIYYHPTNGGAEFIEFFNRTSSEVNLSGWRVDGAAFQFPNGAVIAANGFFVLVGATNYSEAVFRSTYNVPTSVPVLMHAFDLKNEGESVALSMPNDPSTNAPIAVDRVRYNDKGPWPTEADGAGLSLERRSASDYGNDPLNWRTSANSPSPGRENSSSPCIVIARGSRWKFHAEGRDLGAAWRTETYSDSGWPTGPAALGKGVPSLLTVLPAPSGVTTYFRKEFAVNDNPTLITNMTLSVRYNDGFVAFLNGAEIARRSLPSGAVNSMTLADLHQGTDYETIDLTAQKGLLRRGKNHLAAEVHRRAVSDLDLVWDTELRYSASSILPGPPPTISISLGENLVVLRWNAVVGRAYQVQRSMDFQQWTAVGGAVVAQESLEVFTDQIGLQNRYYRIVLLD